jgi:hypothetical protein
MTICGENLVHGPMSYQVAFGCPPVTSHHYPIAIAKSDHGGSMAYR